LRDKEDAIPSRDASLGAWIRRVLLFHLVCVTWIFFRAPSIGDAFAFLGGLGRFAWVPEYATACVFLAAATLPLFFIDCLNEWRNEEYVLAKSSYRVRVAVAMSLMLATLLFAGSSTNAFIYFQF